MFDLDEIRITNKRSGTREALARKVQADLGVRARAVATAAEAVRDADIVIEATRLEKPQVLIEDAWLKPRCLLVTYGWIMAVDPLTVLTASKIVVDDWEQCARGGQLYPLIESPDWPASGFAPRSARLQPGERAAARRMTTASFSGIAGFAISDIMLGAHILSQAEAGNVGQQLTLFDEPDE